MSIKTRRVYAENPGEMVVLGNPSEPAGKGKKTGKTRRKSRQTGKKRNNPNKTTSTMKTKDATNRVYSSFIPAFSVLGGQFIGSQASNVAGATGFVSSLPSIAQKAVKVGIPITGAIVTYAVFGKNKHAANVAIGMVTAAAFQVWKAVMPNTASDLAGVSSRFLAGPESKFLADTNSKFLADSELHMDDAGNVYRGNQLVKPANPLALPPGREPEKPSNYLSEAEEELQDSIGIQYS